MAVLEFKTPKNSLELRLKRYGTPLDKLASREYVEISCYVGNYELVVNRFAKLGINAWYDREHSIFESYCVVRVSIR